MIYKSNYYNNANLIATVEVHTSPKRTRILRPMQWSEESNESN